MATRVILFVAASLACVSAHPAEEHELAYNKVVLPQVLKCASESGTAPDLFKVAKESSSADGISGCFMNCVFKGIGIINDKGLYDTDKADELAKANLTKEEDLNKFLEISKLCAKVNDAKVPDDDQDCERAALLFKCAVEHRTLLLGQ